MRRYVARIVAPFFDVIFPLKPHSARTKARTLAQLPLAPAPFHLCNHDMIALLSYRHPAVCDAIRALKFEGSRDAAMLLTEALADYLDEDIASWSAFSAKPVILVPVPLHEERRRERGFNQIERILDAMPARFRDGTTSRIVPRALIRIRATPHQTALSRAERLRNIRGAFRAPAGLLADTHVIIIDDVVTTGATLAECADVAKRAGAVVTLIALARA